MSEHPRCDWCAGDELMQAYHDTEWGTPIRDDDRAQFEFLVLEGAQAALSWRTILHKRAGYRRAYEGFDPARVAGYGDAERDALLGNAEIVRNRLKVAGLDRQRGRLPGGSGGVRQLLLLPVAQHAGLEQRAGGHARRPGHPILHVQHRHPDLRQSDAEFRVRVAAEAGIRRLVMVDQADRGRSTSVALSCPPPARRQASIAPTSRCSKTAKGRREP